MKIAITGAAGNLGSALARQLLAWGYSLRLITHRTRLPQDLAENPGAEAAQADLGETDSLAELFNGIDCVIHLAGVLFAPHPEKFLEKTNVGYLANAAAAARHSGVGKFLLLSFPHVEGETTPEKPARGGLGARPASIHAQTRLEAEKRLLACCEGSAMTPIILRAGIVYGPGVKLTEAARRLMRWRLMAVWRKPTWAHLIAQPDLHRAIQAALEKPGVRGVYNICDDQPLTVQEFLDRLAAHWGYSRPRRLPEWMFRAAGASCESFASIFGVATPLNRDIIRIGMTSSVADTSRMKRELLSELDYPTIEEGLALFDRAAV